MDQEKIGKFILKLRKEKNLTQQQLADILKVTDRAISKWENGRGMPDLSLFKSLCETLDISVNDLISGYKVPKEKYQEKLESNTLDIINYTNSKIEKKNYFISFVLIIFGILIDITAMTIFKSESSFGSIYSIFGILLSTFGIYILTKKSSKKILFMISYFIVSLSTLLFIDYLSVINIKQAPRFSIYKITSDSAIYYDTLFYDVIRCNLDTKDEYYKLIKNQNYNSNNIKKYCK